METQRQGHSLSNEDISRYSRQIILPEIGPIGQERLRGASVLVVGCGGLGCPVALYLAAAGVGRLNLVDPDVVDASNLQRQVGHSEAAVASSKAHSLAAAVRRLNSGVQVAASPVLLSSGNAAGLLASCDIVVDCTDNVASRYLLSDAAVWAGKPLVSGSALRWEGQLSVYAHKGGPCYRCLFPAPPPPSTVASCSEGGVLGPVVGLIGMLQAIETLKIIVGLDVSFSGALLLFDGLEGTSRKVKMRPRSPDCVVCGDAPTITDFIDYADFCGSKPCDKTCSISLLAPSQRVSVFQLREALRSSLPSVSLFLDVRPSVEFATAALPHFVNVPLRELERDPAAAAANLADVEAGGQQKVFVLCHHGNDSQKAVLALRTQLGEETKVVDVEGGLQAWHDQIDDNFPVY